MSERDTSPQAAFGDWLIAGEQSPAYAEFCRRVYGTEFVQFNNLSRPQLDRVLALGGFSCQSRVLDLGCGIGTQAEFISDATGAQVTGVDFAPKAISRANARTANKSDRLRFELGDLEQCTWPAHSFDVVVAFDPLSFVRDLDDLLRRLTMALAPGAQLLLFYTQVRLPRESDERLTPEGTRLGHALSRQGLEFSATDFTQENEKFWKDSLRVGQELAPAFEAEGRPFLWLERLQECREILAFHERSCLRRYLYHVRLSA